MATHEDARMDFCSYCLSCDRGLFKYSLKLSPSLKSIFQVEELLFCYVCTKFAKNAEEFIQKVGNAQKMLQVYGAVVKVDTIRQQMQPLRYLTSLCLDLIHISPEEAGNCTEKDDIYKRNSCGGKIQENDMKVEIKLEKLQNNHDDDDLLDPTYFDTKDNMVAEEVDLKLLKKETAKKRGRPKKKKKREEKDILMEEIKHKTEIKRNTRDTPEENKPKDLIHISPEEAGNCTEKDDIYKRNSCGGKIQENDMKVEIKLEKLQNNHDDGKLGTPFTDLIHISPEEAGNCTEKDDIYKRNSCGGKIQENDMKVEIKLEKLQNNHDDDDLLDPTYFDTKDNMVAEEVDLKLLKKETAKKRGRPKKKKKREEKDVLMEEIKHKTEIKRNTRDTPEENKPKDYSYVEVIHLSPSEQQQERAAQASSRQYVEAPHKCEECIKRFNLKTGYNRHMMKHRPSRGVYECEICKIRIASKRLLEAHVRNHSLRYKCKICNIVRVNRKSIKYHYSVRHDTEAILKCPECGKIGRCRESLRRHVRRAHSAHARATCHHCQKTLRKDSLLGHMVTHHSDSVKSYACEQCEKRFVSRSHLTKHMLAHTDSKEFYCVECDKNFKSLSGLNNHLANTLSHVTTTELRYPCSHCDKRFSNKRDQDNHINANHRNYRPFKCDKCDKAYVSSWYLKHHTRLAHEGYKRPRKWPCKYCDMVFDRNEVLKGHTRIHTGEKPYQCDICMRRFTQPTTMRSHRNVVHLKLTRNGQPKPTSCY